MQPRRVGPEGVNIVTMPEDIRARFARVLRRWRDELGLTQEQAAAKCELSVRYWRSVEAGEPAVGLETCEQIVRGLGQTWETFGAAMTAGDRALAGAPAALHERLDVVWRHGRAKTALSAFLQVVPPAERGRSKKKT